MTEIVAEVEELPKAIVRRVVKEKLNQLSENDNMSIHKDALLAFSEGARIFIHYLSATANDICRDSKRQTVNADDVLKALEEIEFSEFVPPLKASLDEFRKKNAAKRGRATKGKEEARKKKKEDEEEKEEEAPVENEDKENNQEEDDEENRDGANENSQEEDNEDGANENNQDDEYNKPSDDEDEHQDDATAKE